MIKARDIPEDELEVTAIRASGPGGQHVNKVSTAIHLRFDIAASTLPSGLKTWMCQLSDRRITADQVVNIKAQRFRSQEKNRADAMDRLDVLLTRAQTTRKARRPTRPGKAAVRRRLDNKTRHGNKKGMRKNVRDWE